MTQSLSHHGPRMSRTRDTLDQGHLGLRTSRTTDTSDQGHYGSWSPQGPGNPVASQSALHQLRTKINRQALTGIQFRTLDNNNVQCLKKKKKENALNETMVTVGFTKPRVQVQFYSFGLFPALVLICIKDHLNRAMITWKSNNVTYVLGKSPNLCSIPKIKIRNEKSFSISCPKKIFSHLLSPFLGFNVVPAVRGSNPMVG